MMRLFLTSASITAFLVVSQSVAARSKPSKPVSWVSVKEVHDGDTLSLDAEWAVINHKGRVLFRVPGNVLVRLHCHDEQGKLCGINTPEIGSKAKCEAENAAAIKARDNLRAMVAASQNVVGPIDPRMDKFGGRLGGDVVGRDLRSMGFRQVQDGVADLYNGGARDPDMWCNRLAPRQPTDLLEQVKGPDK